MKKLALWTTIGILALSQVAMFLTAIHFVLTVSQTHAIVFCMLYMIQTIGGIQLRYLLKNSEEK